MALQPVEPVGGLIVTLDRIFEQDVDGLVVEDVVRFVLAAEIGRALQGSNTFTPCIVALASNSNTMSSESTSAPAAATGSGAAGGEGSGRGVTFGTDGVRDFACKSALPC